MTEYKPQPLRFSPGIQRDGTRMTAPGNYIDGQWVRFTNGRPRKIGGYRQLTPASDGIPRSFENHLKAGVNYLHIGSSTNMRQMRFDSDGVSSGLPIVRTPVAYSVQGDELWQFGTAYDPITANAAAIVAHPGRNLNDISSDVVTSIYTGSATDTSALTALTGLAPVSGGICVVHPYLTFFGSDGYFGWSGPNNFSSQAVTDGGGEARPTSQKIIRGFSVRGGNGPAGVYFSLNALLRTSFIGGTATWAFDTVSDEITVMSSRSMAMSRNDILYWMGTDGFFQFSDSVSELPNTYCSDWVFDNINVAQRQKCFAFANTRFGEIWFCFPFGDATECSHAAIYNYRTGEWYDTRLPNGGRSGALMPSLYRNPIIGGVEETEGTYRIWEHETGTDEVRGSNSIAIRSFIETSDVTLITAQEPVNNSISCVAVEPDVKQAGDMTLTITGNANARSLDVDAEAINFPPGPTENHDDQILRSKVERRQMRFRWESNVAGGNFELGLPIAHIGVGSGRSTG